MGTSCVSANKNKHKNTYSRQYSNNNRLLRQAISRQNQQIPFIQISKLSQMTGNVQKENNSNNYNDQNYSYENYLNSFLSNYYSLQQIIQYIETLEIQKGEQNQEQILKKKQVPIKGDKLLKYQKKQKQEENLYKMKRFLCRDIDSIVKIYNRKNKQKSQYFQAKNGNYQIQMQIEKQFKQIMQIVKTQIKLRTKFQDSQYKLLKINAQFKNQFIKFLNQPFYFNEFDLICQTPKHQSQNNLINQLNSHTESINYITINSKLQFIQIFTFNGSTYSIVQVNNQRCQNQIKIKSSSQNISRYKQQIVQKIKRNNININNAHSITNQKIKNSQQISENPNQNYYAHQHQNYKQRQNKQNDRIMCLQFIMKFHTEPNSNNNHNDIKYTNKCISSSQLKAIIKQAVENTFCNDQQQKNKQQFHYKKSHSNNTNVNQEILNDKNGKNKQNVCILRQKNLGALKLIVIVDNQVKEEQKNNKNSFSSCFNRKLLNNKFSENANKDKEKDKNDLNCQSFFNSQALKNLVINWFKIDQQAINNIISSNHSKFNKKQNNNNNIPQSLYQIKVKLFYCYCDNMNINQANVYKFLDLNNNKSTIEKNNSLNSLNFCKQKQTFNKNQHENIRSQSTRTNLITQKYGQDKIKASSEQQTIKQKQTLKRLKNQHIRTHKQQCEDSQQMKDNQQQDKQTQKLISLISSQSAINTQSKEHEQSSSNFQNSTSFSYTQFSQSIINANFKQKFSFFQNSQLLVTKLNKNSYFSTYFIFQILNILVYELDFNQFNDVEEDISLNKFTNKDKIKHHFKIIKRNYNKSKLSVSQQQIQNYNMKSHLFTTKIIHQVLEQFLNFQSQLWSKIKLISFFIVSLFSNQKINPKLNNNLPQLSSNNQNLVSQLISNAVNDILYRPWLIEQALNYQFGAQLSTKSIQSVKFIQSHGICQNNYRDLYRYDIRAKEKLFLKIHKKNKKYSPKQNFNESKPLNIEISQKSDQNYCHIIGKLFSHKSNHYFKAMQTLKRQKFQLQKIKNQESYQKILTQNKLNKQSNQQLSFSKIFHNEQREFQIRKIMVSILSMYLDLKENKNKNKNVDSIGKNVENNQKQNNSSKNIINKENIEILLKWYNSNQLFSLESILTFYSIQALSAFDNHDQKNFLHPNTIPQQSLLISKLQNFAKIYHLVKSFYYDHQLWFGICEKGIKPHPIMQWIYFCGNQLYQSLLIHSKNSQDKQMKRYKTLLKNILDSIEVDTKANVKNQVESRLALTLKSKLQNCPIFWCTGSYVQKSKLEISEDISNQSDYSDLINQQNQAQTNFSLIAQLLSPNPNHLKKFSGLLHWGKSMILTPCIYPLTKNFNNISHIKCGFNHLIFSTSQHNLTQIYIIGSNINNQIQNLQLLQQHKIQHKRQHKKQKQPIKLLQLQQKKLYLLKQFIEDNNKQSNQNISNYNNKIINNSNAKQKNLMLACGNEHSCVLYNGKLFAWGEEKRFFNFKNYYFDAIQCGGLHTVGIKSGKVYSWGRAEGGQLGHPLEQLQREEKQQTVQYFISSPKLIKKLQSQNIVKVACGDAHTLFLTENGTVYVTGFSYQGQLGIGLTGNSEQFQIFQPIKLNFKQKIVNIWAGPTYSFFKKQNKKLYACGLNDCSQLGIQKVLNIYKKVKPSMHQNKKFAKYSPKLLPAKLGDIQFSEPKQIQQFSMVTRLNPLQIICGQNHSLSIVSYGIKQQKITMGWGSNKSYQLTQQFNNKQTITPKIIQSLHDFNIKQIACGIDQTFVLINYLNNRNNKNNSVQSDKQYNSYNLYQSYNYLDDDLIKTIVENNL